jgi:formate dehydrogenase maturation protein FdhE
MFSWDKAIDRARHLGETVAPGKELLMFYATVLASQKEIYDSLRGRRDWLPSGLLEEDLSVLQQYIDPFVQSVKSVSPPALAEQAAHVSTETLLHYWHDRSDKLFFSKAFLQPYAQWLVQSGALSKNPRAENRCHYCFGKPQVSFLRAAEAGAESGNRNLVCATCLSSWEFRRVVCASCGEEQPAKLSYYQTNEYEHVRIEACESCKHYLKGIDLTRLGFAVPLVDDVAAAALDLWATETGYAKMELNLVGL